MTKAASTISPLKRVHIPVVGNMEVYRRKRWHRAKLLFATRLDLEGNPLVFEIQLASGQRVVPDAMYSVEVTAMRTNELTFLVEIAISSAVIVGLVAVAILIW